MDDKHRTSDCSDMGCRECWGPGPDELPPSPNFVYAFNFKRFMLDVDSVSCFNLGSFLCHKHKFRASLNSISNFGHCFHTEGVKFLDTKVGIMLRQQEQYIY